MATAPGENTEGPKEKPCKAPAYAWIYPQLVKVARDHGYALAIHGSCNRDLIDSVTRKAINDCKHRGRSMVKADSPCLFPDRFENPKDKWIMTYLDDAGRDAFVVVATWNDRGFSIDLEVSQ